MNSYSSSFEIKCDSDWAKKAWVLARKCQQSLREACWLVMITIWLFGVRWLYHSKTCCCTFIMLIWCSRGKADDFSTSNCFSFSDIHKENVSNIAPNSSHWVFISSRVLTLKQKSINCKLTKVKILANKQSCEQDHQINIHFYLWSTIFSAEIQICLHYYVYFVCYSPL